MKKNLKKSLKTFATKKQISILPKTQKMKVKGGGIIEENVVH